MNKAASLQFIISNFVGLLVFYLLVRLLRANKRYHDKARELVEAQS